MKKTRLNEGGVMKWGQKKEVPGSYRQNAYTDTREYDIPYEGEPDEKAIQQALSKKSSGGAGVIGSSYGKIQYELVSIDPKKKTIRVRSTLYIGESRVEKIKEMIKEELSNSALLEYQKDSESDSKKSGDVWKTTSGKWGAKNKSGNVKYFPAQFRSSAEAYSRKTSNPVKEGILTENCAKTKEYVEQLMSSWKNNQQLIRDTIKEFTSAPDIDDSKYPLMNRKQDAQRFREAALQVHQNLYIVARLAEKLARAEGEIKR